MIVHRSVINAISPTLVIICMQLPVLTVFCFISSILNQLHALQAEQALLIQKRSQAQEQLQEAQRAQVCN